MDENNELNVLNQNTLSKDYDFWKNYRQSLYKIIKEQESEERLPKTPKNIIEMAEKNGIKATARYFNIDPSSVRYYIKKFKT